MTREPINCLVWLEWPERCFRANDSDIKFLEELVPEGSRVQRVKTEASFLRSRPRATHAIVWSFKKEWFALAPKLKVLATPGAGRELVAWRDAPEGVKVHFGGFHGPVIAESVAGFMLAWARGFFRVQSERLAGRGIWPRERFGEGMFTIAGTKAVIAGYGKIGRAIGDKLTALGVDVHGFSRSNIKEMPSEMKSAKWFIMALPSDTGTDDFLCQRLLSKLPIGAVVINIGRGNAVDEHALAKAILAGKLSGAYLDVFKNEPTVLNPRAGDGEGLSPLWDARNKNIIAMPHSTAFTNDYIKRSFKELYDEGFL